MSSNLLPVSPMATETVRDSTVPNHDETELTEFQKNQKRLFLSLRSSSLCFLTLMFSKTKGTLCFQLICHTISYPIRLSTRGPLSSLEECFDMFCQGISGEGPYLDHVLGYWKAHQENPDKILFLKYETVRADPLPYLKRLAEFMGYGFTDEEKKNGVVEKVVNLCSFETMKNLEANKGDKEREDHPSPYTNSTYFRKGKTGDWVNYLTPEMAARMDGIMEEKFKGTGLLENGE
ncbi:BnaC06g24250D [Brassica napus]|uniref:Sulfotransferase n=1 Tax=Brassica napus TaxID=3708 RepID=A0A078IL44_BRANA|nr:BnaC06g24250D [Brassica napus]